MRSVVTLKHFISFALTNACIKNKIFYRNSLCKYTSLAFQKIKLYHLHLEANSKRDIKGEVSTEPPTDSDWY